MKEENQKLRFARRLNSTNFLKLNFYRIIEHAEISSIILILNIYNSE
jgi:hypothetical protein